MIEQVFLCPKPTFPTYLNYTDSQVQNVDNFNRYKHKKTLIKQGFCYICTV